MMSPDRSDMARFIFEKSGIIHAIFRDVLAGRPALSKVGLRGIASEDLGGILKHLRTHDFISTLI
jgi:acyl CoA:acetate/3-ketoacid CoA transferase